MNKEKVVGTCCCEYFNISSSPPPARSIERVASDIYEQKKNYKFKKRHDNAKERHEEKQQSKTHMCIIQKNYIAILRSGLKYEYNKTTIYIHITQSSSACHTTHFSLFASFALHTTFSFYLFSSDHICLSSTLENYLIKLY